MSNEISTKFNQTALTIYVEVNGVGKTFYIAIDTDIKPKQARDKRKQAWPKHEQDAADWFVDECNFQNQNKSLYKCRTSLLRLLSLLEKVRPDFPSIDNFKILVDDYNQCISLDFGSISVTESDKGFNIEIVSNWFTKQKISVCKNVSESVAAAVICNSQYSQSFEDTEARRLHLTEKNLDFIEDFLESQVKAVYLPR